jgi:DnaA regulatory inactivator Hda
LFLWGPAGTGKTHILRALITHLDRRRGKEASGPVIVTAAEAPPTFPDIQDLAAGASDSLELPAVVAVDDVDRLTEEYSSSLWILFNKMIRIGAPLMMASRKSPDEIFQSNPHLKTRITAGLVFQLDLPDDRTRLMIIDKMARDRNVRISQEVCRYLLTRKSRNIKEVEKLLDTLDKASLERKRPITLPLIKLLENDGVI